MEKLAARYTVKGPRTPATVRIGPAHDPSAGDVIPVTGKAEARRIAKERGATPWNF